MFFKPRRSPASLVAYMRARQSQLQTFQVKIIIAINDRFQSNLLKNVQVHMFMLRNGLMLIWELHLNLEPTLLPTCRLQKQYMLLLGCYLFQLLERKRRQNKGTLRLLLLYRLLLRLLLRAVAQSIAQAVVKANFSIIVCFVSSTWKLKGFSVLFLMCKI